MVAKTVPFGAFVTVTLEAHTCNFALVHVETHVCLFACLCACVYVCVCVCKHVCMNGMMVCNVV